MGSQQHQYLSTMHGTLNPTLSLINGVRFLQQRCTFYNTDPPERDPISLKAANVSRVSNEASVLVFSLLLKERNWEESNSSRNFPSNKRFWIEPNGKRLNWQSLLKKTVFESSRNKTLATNAMVVAFIVALGTSLGAIPYLIC